MSMDEERDAVDALFARMEVVDPPPDFLARVMARAQQGEIARWPRWQRALFSFAYVAALVMLAVLAFMTGIELERAGLRDLLSLAVRDVRAVTESPDIYLAAIRDAIPWTHVLAVALDLVVLVVATRLVLKVSTPRTSQRARAA